MAVRAAAIAVVDVARVGEANAVRAGDPLRARERRRRCGRPVAQPVVNVVALFVIVMSLIPVWLAQRLTAERTGGLPGADAR